MLAETVSESEKKFSSALLQKVTFRVCVYSQHMCVADKDAHLLIFNFPSPLSRVPQKKIISIASFTFFLLLLPLAFSLSILVFFLRARR
jgi:hypothetical protein